MDKEADMKEAEGRDEATGLIEPLVLWEGSRHRPELTDLALELAQRSAGFRRSLPESLLSSLATLVRAMNCYYSNVIEGHDTHPVDIETVPAVRCVPKSMGAQAVVHGMPLIP